MSIPETIRFDNTGEAVPSHPGRELVRRLFLTLVILLTAFLSFGLGRLTQGRAGEGVKIELDPSLSSLPAPATQAASASQTLPAAPTVSEVVASKSGSKYHYLSCPGAKQIKEANKITFASAQAAEAAGYTLAGNCTPR